MSATSVFPTFKDTAELGQYMQDYAKCYDDYSESKYSIAVKPQFLLDIIGPPKGAVRTLATIKNAESTVPLRVPTGINRAFSVPHQMMRALGEDISHAFAHYYEGHGTRDDFSPPLADTLFGRYRTQTITAKIATGEYEFYPGHDIVKQAYLLGAFAFAANARGSDAQKRALTGALGARNTTFQHMMALLGTLEKNFSSSNSTQAFANTGWSFNLNAVNKVFTDHAEDFHNARLYFYVHDVGLSEMVKRRLFWKERPPALGKPIPLLSGMDAACCLMALTEKLMRNGITTGHKEMYKRLLDGDFSRHSQQLSQYTSESDAAAFLAAEECAPMFRTLDAGIRMLESIDRREFQKCRDALGGLQALRQKGIGQGIRPRPTENPERGG